MLLSQKEMAGRRKELAAEGLGEDGASLPPEKDQIAELSGGGSPPGMRTEAAGVGTARAHALLGLAHTRLSHVVGCTTDTAALLRLPLEHAHAVVVIDDLDNDDAHAHRTRLHWSLPSHTAPPPAWHAIPPATRAPAPPWAAPRVPLNTLGRLSAPLTSSAGYRLASWQAERLMQGCGIELQIARRASS